MPRGPGLRVIGGELKGRRLNQVGGNSTRPIISRVKEALFNIIGADIKKSAFLDLFGGTGGVGIEAISRGAERVVFVENDSRTLSTLRANIAQMNVQERCEVLPVDALSLLSRKNVYSFDYIFIAPPQYLGMWSRALGRLDKYTHWLNPGGWIIAQIDPNEYTEMELDSLTLFDKRKYGNTALCFYERTRRGGGV